MSVCVCSMFIPTCRCHVVCLSPFIVCAGVLVTGEGVEAVGFVRRHPEVLLNVLVFGIASAVGQVRGRSLQQVR